ncbi:MAG: hypothetical protein NXI13_16345 [Proteobacteria bacterium]|nr:hypothetical protein [Pseudomonadota bacterium]
MTEQNKLGWKFLPSHMGGFWNFEFAPELNLSVEEHPPFWAGSVASDEQYLATEVFGTEELAKSWCITTAKQILTEALENLNRLEEEK